MLSNNPPPEIVLRPPGDLRPHPHHARTHSRKQIRQIAASIEAFGFLVAVLVDEQLRVLAGHGRVEAAKLLGLAVVPTVSVVGLSDAQQRAFMLADNKLTENAGWDREALAVELGELLIELPTIDLDIGITGFNPEEIDLIIADRETPQPDPADRVFPAPGTATSRRSDVWLLGEHRLACGDARSAVDVDRLMAGGKARLMLTDPPYNVSVAGHIQGRRGKVRHPEFAMASGEMSDDVFEAFLRAALAQAVRVSIDGAIAYVCMDWRHASVLERAGRAVIGAPKNVVVWNKTSPGQGSFYRSQHELIFVFKIGDGPHINTFGLGATGRMRSNVWSYPGANSFGRGRQAALAMHPTVKPLALVVDALRDASLKGDVVLDLFGGSGTTLLAAEKIGRRARIMELDPRYVDVIIARWQAYTRQEAVLEGDGRSFAEVRAAGREEGDPLVPVTSPRPRRRALPPGAGTGDAAGARASSKNPKKTRREPSR